MERPRHTKSRSLTSIEGNFLTQNYRVTRNSSDFPSYNDGPVQRDMHMFNTARAPSKYSTGESIKKLLAVELSKEMEAKKSPGVVAKLMGFDGLPNPQHDHRQKRWSSNQQRRTPSNIVHKDGHLFDGQPSKRISLDHKEFKDVYEDLEAYHVATQRNPSKWNSKLKKHEVSVLEQKVPISRTRHRDEDLNDLGEFTGNIDAVNPNDELLFKFLMQPDSLRVKHVNDIKCDNSSSLHRHIAILKPLNSEKYESNAKAWNSGRDCTCKNDGRSHRNRKDGLLLDPLIRQSSAKSPTIQLDETRVKHKLPTQIVVLKPRKSSDTMPSVLLGDFSHPYVAHRRRPSAENVGAAPLATCALSDFQGISKPKCREAREVAKKITGQIKETFATYGNRPISFKYSKERGYAGDESSNDVYDSDSDSMSDVITAKAGKLSDPSNQSRCPAKSTVNREAKKRLSERWKMANKYQSEEIIARGNTLGEMLELPEKKRSPGNLDVYNSRGDRTVGLASNNRMSEWNGPSGISSNDGWKDRCTEKQSISRSIAPPSGSKSQKRSERQKAHPSDRHVLTRDTMDECKSRAVNGNRSSIEGYSPKALRSNGKGHLSCQDKYVVNIESTSETTCSLSKSKEKLELSEHIMGSSDPESVVMWLPDLAASEINICDSFVCNQEDSSLQDASICVSEEGPVLSQCPAPEPEASESFSEAEHPSPVSVLEATSSPSGSEGFRGVFDGLQELRKQLQLLKMDSAEVSTTVSNDDDFLPQIEEDHMLNIESWEDMYIVDLLINSGLEKLHLHTFNAGWRSLQIPVCASVFDTLEKKYSDGIAERRSERKLLFDRINSALVDIFLHDIKSCPWVKPAPHRFDSNWQNHSLKDELKRSLATEDNGTEWSTPIKMLDIEMEWSSNRTDIFMLGKDIEKILTDELIMEILSI